MTSIFKSRTGAVVAGAAVLAALGGVGTAAAAGTIGSTQIRDHSIRSVDFRKGAVNSSAILNGSVNKYDLSKSVQALLDMPGPAGAKGDAGTAGTNGTNGAAGTNGTNGAAGTNGENGTDGDDGASAYDSYVATTSDDPVLSESDWVASLKGDTGENGTNGTNGTNGENGTNGTDGDDGASAYDSYVATTSDDPVLSESAWVASLKGDTGENGTNGTNGENGTNGTDGTDGTDGVSGYHQVSTAYPSQTGRQTLTASCPTDEVVLGGGATGSGNSDVVSSWPSASNVWSVTMNKANGGYSATVYAVCAAVPATP